MVMERAVEWFFAVLLGGLSAAYAGAAWSSVRLGLRGRWADGEIVRVREAEYSDGDSRFYPVVAFTPRGGERMEVESPVGKPRPPDVWDSEVRVRYDPARPQRVEVAGYERDGTAMNLLLAMALAGGAVIVLRAALG
ncbi:DUF3592 domain-containing protein [Kitasatospora sp. NPDC004799]|uniref:DUF3592 domain-containing protein n=1 Tax=Kitasatospora sp. NPDC004799 TaxID=3154460 RepID=UPI0033BE00E9